MDVTIHSALKGGIHATGPLRGTVTVPADKAICHRAVLAAAIASGETTIEPWPSADDCQRTLAVVQALGISVTKSGETMLIRGRGKDGLRPAAQPVFCGESGTTLRLAAGLAAGQPFSTTLSAGPSLSHRPMRRIAEPLTRMGAAVEGQGGSAGEFTPPLTIRGKRPLTAVRYELPVASAQVKSAVLLAGLFAERPTTIIEPIPTRDHTERMLSRFGASVRREGQVVIVEPGALRSPGTLAIPGDFSSAAFLLVGASLVPGSRLTIQAVSLNPTRTTLLNVLERMGASIRIQESGEAWEPSGAVTVEARPLRGTTITPAEAPGLIDELPILMAAAACAQGLTRFEGIGELRVKETDRIRSMMQGLKTLGARVTLPEPDVVEVEGGHLTGGVVESAGDHRTAMSLAVAGLFAEGATTIRGAECVAKSFPDFFDRLRAATGFSTVKSVDKA